MCFPELWGEILPPPSLESVGALTAGMDDVKFAVTTAPGPAPLWNSVSPPAMGTLMEQAQELGAGFECCCQFSPSPCFFGFTAEPGTTWAQKDVVKGE